MRRSSGFWKYVLAPGAMGMVLYALGARADETSQFAMPGPDGSIRLVRQDEKKKDVVPKKAQPPGPVQPPGPTQPPQPTIPPKQPPAPVSPDATAPPSPGAGTGTAGGGAGFFGGAATSAAPSTSGTGGSVGTGTGTTVSGQEATGRATSDAGDLLSRSQSGGGVDVQRRNPITTDPRVRGYHVPQLLTVADGAFYMPARLDLDTIVSKIDSNSIKNVTVVKGPYNVRYGPGFAFLDIETIGTERYENGWEGHGSTALTYKTQGNQYRGRQNFWGGSSDWGFRFGYDIAAGSDYSSGNGTQMPSSYNSQNVDFAFGWNFSPNSRLEVKYVRQDLHDVEYPGQVYDINQGITDAFAMTYTLKNQEFFDKMQFDAWYNYTRFDGDSFHPSKQRQIPQLANPSINLQGFTTGDVVSPGFRQSITWGQDKCPQFTVGVNLNYLSQYLNEYDTRALATGFFNNPIPRSHWANPGIFADVVLPLGDRLTVRAGVRADLVSTDIDSLPPGPFFPPNPNIPATDVQRILATLYQTTKFDNEYNLFGGFATAEYKLTDQLTPFANFGIGNRPPSLTELYALGPFLATVQNGLNSVVGNPSLSPENALQIEVGMKANYERFRGGFSLFYSWIHNYITYQTLQAVPVQVLRYVNTDQASLSGTEIFGEYDLNSWLTPFGSMTFVEGRDDTRDARGSFVQPQQFTYTVNGVPGVTIFSPTARNSLEEPLPGIPPMEFRMGLRFHEPGNNSRWGLETTARMVMAQGRIAQSLQEQKSQGFTVFDIRAFWQASKSLLLTAGIENVFDRNYREALDLRTGTIPIPNATTNAPGPVGPGVLQPGINFYFGATLTY